jgi:acyl-CoA-binding protein
MDSNQTALKELRDNLSALSLEDLYALGKYASGLENESKKLEP